MNTTLCSGSMEDFMNAEITDFTNNGKCSCCGSCCTSLLPVSKREIRIIKDYIKKNNIKFSNMYPLADQTCNLLCPFCDMTKELKCKIYEVRPEICRIYNCHYHSKGIVLPVTEDKEIVNLWVVL